MLTWKSDAEAESRAARFGDRANQGSITGEERDEHRSHVEIAHVIAILERNARRLLATQDGE